MNRKQLREAIYQKANGRCAYCGTKLLRGWHIDHLKPIERKIEWFSGKGFRQTGEVKNPENDNFDNLMPSCPSCNIEKNKLTLEQFRERIQNKLKVLNNNNTYKFAKRYGLLKETRKKVIFHFEKYRK